MLNKAPIFVNGFHRGGTNILMNIIASHPDVCMVAGETHEVFYGKSTEPVKKWVHRAFYIPIWIVARQHIFWPGLLDNRNKIPRYMMHYIDALFYFNKLTVRENQFKAEGIQYAKAEIGKSRMLTKNGTGTVLATELFSEMYPDATFIALVRNGLALCEGMVRRGYSAEDAGRVYEKICQKMIHDSHHMDNYYVVRFEDMISDPVRFIEEIYGYAGLDISLVAKFRFEAKASTDRDGALSFTVGADYKKMYWFEKEHLKDYFRQDVDENQIAALTTQDQHTFLKQASRSMEHFGYLPSSGVESLV